MKNLTVAQKMRRVAGMLYLALSVYQAALFSVVISMMVPSNTTFSWILQVLLVGGAAAMSVWMFGGDAVLKTGVRRAVVTGTAALVMFQLLNYSMLARAVDYTFATYRFLQPLQGKPTWQYVSLVIQLLLVILAAFFITNCRDALDYNKNNAGQDSPAKDIGETKQALSAAVRPAQLSPDLDKPLEVPIKPDERRRPVYTPRGEDRNGG